MPGNGSRKVIGSDNAAEESATAALSGAASSFLDQSFLAGVSGLLDAINDPERNSKRFMSQFAQGLVPASGLMRNVTQAIDPVVRKPEGAMEAVESIIPGMSQRVPARTGRFGQEITRPGGPLQRGFLVPEVSPEQQSPIGELLDRLDLAPGVPRPGKLMVNGQAIKPTRDQADAISRAIGRERQRLLVPLVPSQAWESLSEGRRLGLKREVEDRLVEATRIVDSREGAAPPRPTTDGRCVGIAVRETWWTSKIPTIARHSRRWLTTWSSTT
jgi:hypothetical protein